jgi:hypothetical protein
MSTPVRKTINVGDRVYVPQVNRLGLPTISAGTFVSGDTTGTYFRAAAGDEALAVGHSHSPVATTPEDARVILSEMVNAEVTRLQARVDELKGFDVKAAPVVDNTERDVLDILHAGESIY